LAICSTLRNGCIEQFTEIRNASDEQWQLLLTNAEAFASNHDIEPIFPEKRVRKTKRMPGELVRDERIIEVVNSFKITVYIQTLDAWCS